MPAKTTAHHLAIESTSRRAFATALDWPGWSRAGKTEEAAVSALLASAPRYAEVAARAGLDFDAGAAPEVVTRVAGSATTDFGVPGAELDSDRAAVSSADLERTMVLVAAAWQTYDEAVKKTPNELRKGPRGGGRDRDKITAHILESEGAYAGMLGAKLALPNASDQAAMNSHRQQLLDALLEVASSPMPEPGARPRRWTFRYAARRIAWHALDHAWEIQDRNPLAV